MTKYTLHGELEVGAASELPVIDGSVDVEQAVRLSDASRSDDSLVSLDVKDDDLLEVELDDGFILWTTIDRLQQDAEMGQQDRASGTTFPRAYPTASRTAQRGLGSNAIRAVRVLGYDLPKQGALAAARKVESQLQGAERFFRIDRDGKLTRDDPGSREPTLILIHGTASSTTNAFSGLFEDNQAIWSQIVDQYDGRVYGFEHCTLTKSPLENAIAFLKAIPTGANLHLVTHSRGGLVGDLIAHGRVDGDVFAAGDLQRELEHAFGDKPEVRDAQRALYQEFNLQIATALPDVTRYVRVGCPAAGTTLASRRLDVYLSIMVNLVSKIPGVGPILGGLGELAAAVAKERTKPEVLPGLEAQMPTSAFVRLLNSAEHVLTSDLTVLAGDSDGFFKNLANLFFWRANDLVVDTRSMYGGAARATRLWHLEENSQVTHVNYFRRDETARVVQRGLLRADGDTTGFNRHKPKSALRGRVDEGKPADHPDRTGVILLPGIMGSHLDIVKDNRRNRIWLDKIDLMRGRGRKLEMGKYDIVPASVLGSPYDDFRDDLTEHGVHVMPMPYDWRRSLVIAAKSLEALIKERLAASQQPLHIVAHSMGGLVASVLIANHPDTWRALRNAGGRLVQAGTPNGGSYAIPQILRGRDKMLRLLAMLDLRADVQAWAQWASRFPGILEMAPRFGGPDFSQKQTWKDLGALAVPTAGDLASARQVWDILDAQTPKLASEGVLYVAGGPTPTPVFDPQANAGHEPIKLTERGDGRVTWDSGIPAGVATWYVPVKHGSLLDKRRAFDGLRELALNGHTRRLTTQRPSVSAALRSAPDDAPRMAPDDQVSFIPTERDLENAALMMDDAPLEIPASLTRVPVCELSVVHGDLRFSRAPIIVGHYRGDQIVHAENALDRCLDGALRSRHQLGIYPGPIGSAEVVLKRSTQPMRAHVGPTGAIVLGLGDVGVLTPGGLTRSIQSGLLRYAQARIENGHDTANMQVAALLVGSGESGVTVARSLEAFMIATANVNRALATMAMADSPQDDDATPAPRHFAKIEFVELYKDVALEALHELHRLRARPGFAINDGLKTRDGGRQRSRSYSNDAWWSRLQITSRHDAESGANDVLEFTPFGGRARASKHTLEVQSALVDRLIADAIKNRGESGPELRETLFELLIPRALKGGASDRRDLQLLLDKGSSGYPWELLTDRRSGDGVSMSLGAGMLRQLRVENSAPVNHPEENRILVVGDPPSALPPLPGAREEATHVADLFGERGDWDVVRHIRDTAGAAEVTASGITISLSVKDYRILHLAGHGVYNPERAKGSGMVIGDSGDARDPYLLINSSQIKNDMLQPELVFINCCHLGRIDRDVPFQKLAANLGEQFIGSGAKAVIAAGWPVDDEAALLFCNTFYEYMLNGSDFGAAVTAARQKIQNKPSNTWAAYQCYGDPGFRLLMDRQVRAAVRGGGYSPNQFLDFSELNIELDNLANGTTMAKTATKRAWIEDQVTSLRTLAESKDWLECRGVLARFARLHAELEDFEQAISEYDRALNIEDSGVTISDLQIHSNLHVRQGAQENNLARVESGKNELEAMIDKFGSNAERHSLLGSAFKRLARLQKDPDAMRDSVRRAAEEYIKGAHLNDTNWYYPATNALLAILLLGGPWASKPTGTSKASKAKREAFEKVPWANTSDFQENLNRVTAEINAYEHERFWDAAAIVQLQVVQAFADKVLDEKKESLVRSYQEVIALYGSDREIASVRDQWMFAEVVADKNGMKKDAQAFGFLHRNLPAPDGSG